MTIKKETLGDAVKVTVSCENTWIDLMLDGAWVNALWFDGNGHHSFSMHSFSMDWDMLQLLRAAHAILQYCGNDFKDGLR